MDERRRFPRFDLTVDVRWERGVSGESIPRPAGEDQTRNVSEGGVCLMVYEDVGVGEQLLLHIKLPTNKVISAVGRVAWRSAFEVGPEKDRKRYDLGIEFLEMNPADHEELKKFLFSLK